MAIDLPREIKRDLALTVSRLAEAGADVKWVEEENFHLTLKFLGEVESAQLPELRVALSRASSDFPPFAFRLGELGAFPSLRRPRVIWAGVKAPTLLPELARRVEGEMTALGFPREERSFSPHLTLGRVRSPAGLTSLARLLETTSPPEGEVRVEEVVLFSSLLSREGPTYTSLARIPLAPPAPRQP